MSGWTERTWARIEAHLPRKLVRIWCDHPKMYVPVYPMMGPAPYKVCERCGHSEVVWKGDYEGLELRPIGARVVDMTGNLGR